MANRKVGRPTNASRGIVTATYPSWSIRKTPLFVTLLDDAHKAYRDRHEGQDTTDSALLRIALRHYVG